MAFFIAILITVFVWKHFIWPAAKAMGEDDDGADDWVYSGDSDWSDWGDVFDTK